MNDSQRRIAELEEELAVTERLLEMHRSVTDAIPPCPTHGAGCLAYALEWVTRKVAAEKATPA